MANMAPIVSVVIISYNSANTILETLESIASQQYSNLELIVSDDGSNDNTVDVAKQWLEVNSSQFVSTQIVESSVNTGISSNLNRGIKQTKGDWIKPIAADDILFPNCIAEYMEFVSVNKNALCVFSQISPFGCSEDVKRNVINFFDASFFTKTIEEQLHHLLFFKNELPAPTAFINRVVYFEKGVWLDERIPMIDDYPFWINCLKAGVTFQYIDKELVGYRVGSGISTTKFSLATYKSCRLFRFYYQYSEWEKNNFEDAVNTIVEEESIVYAELIRLKQTKAYRLGKLLLAPIYYIRDILLKNEVG